MRKALLAAAITVAPLTTAPAVASAQSVHFVNDAGLTTGQINSFKAAVGAVVNNDLRNQWGTSTLGWSSSASWTLIFYNSIGPVHAICGNGAAGCHGTLYGRPVGVIDTRFADTGRIWTVAGSHELIEMLVNPYLNNFVAVPGLYDAYWLREVADPVEDDYRRINGGAQITDFVDPAWYENVDARQDDMYRLGYAGYGTYEFSCPTGYAHYLYGGAWQTLTATCYSPRRAAAAAARSTIRTDKHGNRFSIFPVAR